MSSVPIIKIVAMLVFGLWLLTILKMMSLGRSIRRESAVHPTPHEEYAPRVYWWTAAMILVASSAHLLVRHRIGGEQGWLFIVHLPAALGFLAALWLLRRYPGTTDVQAHRRLSRWLLLPSLVITVLTGPVLIWRM